MKKIFLLILFVVTSLINSQQIRVMSYNLENYPNGRSGVNISYYEPYYKNIIGAINPDVVVGIEVVQDSGVNQFLNNVLSPNEYGAAEVDIAGTNSSGNDGNDCAFYYKKMF
jgi:hypothetical protein